MAAAAKLGGEGESNPTPVEGQQATPQGNETPEAATAPDSFTNLDPNTLPPEVQPYYKSMQADFTRKTQEIAEQRKQFESLGPLDQLQQANELLQALQDPNELVRFHAELSNALQEMGLTPAQANAAAAQHIQEQTQAPQDQNWSDDPDERRIQELEQRLSQFESAQQAAEQQRQAEMLQMAVVGEMNRQESIIRESNPSYTQDDINAVYELSAFYDGNLLDAQRRYEEIVSSRVASLLNSKGTVASNPAFTPATPAQGSERGTSFGGDLEAAHRAAMEIVRTLPQ